MKIETIQQVMALYGVESDAVLFGNGHINDTYKVGDLIIQRINTDIFKDYPGLMFNVLSVTEFLRDKIIKSGGDPDRETLTVVKTVAGCDFVESEIGVFRAYKLIHGARSYDAASPELLYEAAKGFGHFQALLADYPANTLVETIPDFHNTRSRYDDLMRAVELDVCSRADSVRDEISFAVSHEKDVDIVTDALTNGTIPTRVTHNDTKLNNVLLDDETGKAVCVIDLDTVMPGSLLFDYGDALRFGASTAAEDETDLDKVKVNLENFEFFTKGFLEGIEGAITEEEIRLLPFSVRLLTLECGMRFLTDYLNGDKYFKISRPEHNLDRARNQFKLVREFENAEDRMREIIKDMF